MNLKKTAKSTEITEMSRIFNDPLNIPLNLLPSYYNLAVDIFEDKIHSNLIIFKSAINGVNSFCDIVSQLNNPLDENLLRLRYGLDGLEPKSFTILGPLFDLTLEGARLRVCKAIERLQHISIAYKCTVPYAIKHLNSLSSHYASLARSLGKSVQLIINNNGKAERFPRETLIDDIVLSVRTHNALKKAGYITIGEVINIPVKELIQIRNMGKKSVAELESVLFIDC